MTLYAFCDRPSHSCNVLVGKINELGYRARRIRMFMPRRINMQDQLINWGSPRLHAPNGVSVWNRPEQLRAAMSKVETARLLDEKDIPHIRITMDKAQAELWCKEGFRALVRRDGLSNGRGIVNYEGQDIGQGQFYARVFPKTHEFRAHVVGGRCIDITQKKHRNGDQTANRLVRSYDNGWVFAHSDLVLSEQEDLDKLKLLAIDAVEALGLDFGAVDILTTVDKRFPRRLHKAVVCEVNTRPGLESPQTIEAYARAFVVPGEGMNREAA